MFNLNDISKTFATQQDCISYLENIRWGKTAACTSCGSTNVLKVKNRNNYKCRDCRKFFNVLTQTIFENTKIPLIKWFKAIYIFTSHKKGISSIQLGKDLGISQPCAWFVLGRVRELVKNKGSFMLEGTVQIDSTYIGGKLHFKSNAKRKEMRSKYKGKVHNEDSKTVVLGFLANGETLHHQVIEAEKHPYLTTAMLEKVKAGSMVVTDEAQAYKNLDGVYIHRTVNHSQSQYVNNGFTTNGIENAFSQLKRGLYGIYHHASPKHLHRYCNEFSFRYNTRKSNEVDRFDKALSQCENSRLRYTELTKKV